MGTHPLKACAKGPPCNFYPSSRGRNMSGRDRSEGWKHAKISGHKYEQTLANELNAGINHDLQEFLESKARSKLINADASFGTAHLNSIFSDKTTSKSDIVAEFESNQKLGISVKKSDSGQVWITSLERFVDCCIHYGIELSEGALWSLCALTGNTKQKKIEYIAPDAILKTLHKKSGELLERKDNRLLAKTIAEYYPENWDELVDFFTDNYSFIASLAFSKGLNANPVAWADMIYYREGSMFDIADICSLGNVDLIDVNSRNRSTIWLPFGFLQVHRPTPKGAIKSGPFFLQFHHNLKRIKQNRVD